MITNVFCFFLKLAIVFTVTNTADLVLRAKERFWNEQVTNRYIFGDWNQFIVRFHWFGYKAIKKFIDVCVIYTHTSNHRFLQIWKFYALTEKLQFFLKKDQHGFRMTWHRSLFMWGEEKTSEKCEIETNSYSFCCSLELCELSVNWSISEYVPFNHLTLMVIWSLSSLRLVSVLKYSALSYRSAAEGFFSAGVGEGGGGGGGWCGPSTVTVCVLPAEEIDQTVSGEDWVEIWDSNPTASVISHILHRNNTDSKRTARGGKKTQTHTCALFSSRCVTEQLL